MGVVGESIGRERVYRGGSVGGVGVRGGVGGGGGGGGGCSCVTVVSLV